MTSRSRFSPMWIAAPVILAIGWLDYISGPELGLSLFYLVPIAATAWRVTNRQAVSLALLAATCWFTADLLWREEGLLFSFWNGFTRVIIYSATAYLVHRVRMDHDALGSMNARLEAALESESTLARTDVVTGLPNARAFLEQLERELARARREGLPVSVLYADLDGFKGVNDHYGHAAGDEVLRRVAEALRASTRAGDSLARLGGDEFCGVLWHADSESAATVVERVTTHMREIAADFPEARLGISIGLVAAHADETNAEGLLARADAVMYEKKQRRRLTPAGGPELKASRQEPRR